MKSPRPYALPILLLYIFSSALLGFAHHEGHSIRLSSQPFVVQHDCGANEIHVSVDGKTHCLACPHCYGRAYLAEAIMPLVLTPVAIVDFRVGEGDTCLESDIFHSGKRGPPAS